MIRSLALFPLLAGLAALQPLAAAEPSSVASAQATPATADKGANGDKPEKKICRMETPTGSIRPVRTCRTKAEIAAQAQQGQDQKAQMDADSLRDRVVQGSRG